MLDGITYTSKADINFDLLTYKIGSYHYNWHEQIELIWLLKGTVETNVDGERFTMHENDLMLINTNCGHATFALSRECIAMRLHITPTFLMSQGVDLGHGSFVLNSVKVPRHPDYNLIRQMLAQLSLDLQQHYTPDFDINELYFRLTGILLHDFFDTTARIKNQPQRRQGSLNRVITYINKLYDQNITLDSAARISHYSSAYLSRIFKAELGINFYEYLTRCRLQHAVFDLENPETKIADIALNNGFKEVKSFNLMFKKHFGQTPSTYRNHLSLSERPQIDQFKQPLSSQQEAWLTQRLAKWVDSTSDNQISACDTCRYKTHFAEYQELQAKVDQLKNLLNQ